MTTHSREIEFKFGVPGKQAFYQLVEYLKLPESVLSEGVTQVNHFFDSRELCLHKKHFAIRLREEKGNNILTMKGEQAIEQKENSVLSNRIEEEVLLPPQAAEDLLHGAITPQQTIKDHFNSKSVPLLQMINAACDTHDLVHIGEFSNVRIHLPPVSLTVDGASEKLEFELDSSTFPDGSVEHEIEIEIMQYHSAESIEAALLELFNQAGIVWHAAPSKAKRFFASLP